MAPPCLWRALACGIGVGEGGAVHPESAATGEVAPGIGCVRVDLQLVEHGVGLARRIFWLQLGDLILV